LDALPPEPPAWPEITPLLHQLVSVGLVTEEPATPDHANPDLSCHELVRERIRARMAQQPQDQGDLTENAIRLSYAEWLEAFFNALQHQDMSLALQAGSRALVYCVQAEAWDRLGRFAGSVVTSTKDPRLLDGLIPHLQAAAETAPEGKARWLCLCFLADAISMSGRPDISLPIYEQAATLARANAEAGSDDALQAWSVLATITGNWAVALAKTGKLDAARDRHLESADASRRAAAPAIHVIGCELEALRINIMQDKTDTALPEVEWRLAQVQLWWMQHGAGQVVPEAPDAEFLARVFIGALDIARSADFARQNWASALQRIETELDVKRALQRSAEDIGETRMNRANVLVEIPGRLGEAKAELEACLELFRNKPDWISKVRGSLANLFDEQGDIAQAIIQQRRALALLEQLPNPTDRAISHNNLANYLNKSCSTGDLIESSYHRLAALLYLVVMQYAQHLQTLLRSYAITFRRAHAAGTEFSPPRVADLLANPAFAPLDQWLQQHQIDLDELQASVDQFLDQARQLALSAENSP
jgi:tetratricopeptide (TPR) repeat protein